MAVQFTMSSRNPNRVVQSLMFQPIRWLPRRKGSSSPFAIMMSYRHMLLVLAISASLSKCAPNLQPVSWPADDAPSTYYCNDSPAWSGPSFDPKDCVTAMSQFFLGELLVHGDVLFEFLAVGAQPQSRYPSQNTPQKFAYGETTHT